MRSSSTRFAIALAGVITAVSAIDGITTPPTVAANQPFEITFANPGTAQYRVLLAAAVVSNARGLSCFLVNDTTLSSGSLTLTIPAQVGPSNDYYSIAIADLTTGQQGATYSPNFNLTGGDGNTTQYEQHLNGAPFWDSAHLPCSAYQCARDCAQASYPADLTDQSAYNTMKSCILACPGVTASAHDDKPAGSAPGGSSETITEALLTIGSSTYTARETTVSSAGKTYTEAILDNSTTLVLGGAARTLTSHTVSLHSSGLAIDGATTVPFSNVVETVSATLSSQSGGETATAALSTSSPSGLAVGRCELGVAGAAIAGFAAVFL